MDSNDFEKTLIHINALVNQFKLTVQESSQETKDQIDQLDKSVSDIKLQVKDLIQSAKNEIRKESDQSLKDAMEKQSIEFEKRLNNISANFKDGVVELFQERKTIASQTRILTWKALSGLTIGLGLMLFFSFKLVWDKQQALSVLMQQHEQIELKNEIKRVTNKLEVLSCGGTPCIKVDTNAERWKSGDDEYLLVK